MEKEKTMYCDGQALTLDELRAERDRNFQKYEFYAKELGSMIIDAATMLSKAIEYNKKYEFYDDQVANYYLMTDGDRHEEEYENEI